MQRGKRRKERKERKFVGKLKAFPTNIGRPNDLFVSYLCIVEQISPEACGTALRFVAFAFCVGSNVSVCT